MKLVIFDLDGTLLDSLTDVANSVNYTLKVFNNPVRTEEEIKRFLGQGPKYLLEQSFSHIEDFEAIYTVYDTHYTAHQNDSTQPYEGIVDLLKKLKEMKIKLAVCSNKQDSITKELVEHIFPNTFDYILGSSAAFERKPSKDMPAHILEILNIDHKDTLYVGDTETDMKTAHNAHLKAIGVTWGFRTKEELLIHSPYKIINKPHELIKIITEKKQ